MRAGTPVMRGILVALIATLALGTVYAVYRIWSPAPDTSPPVFLPKSVVAAPKIDSIRLSWKGKKKQKPTGGKVVQDLPVSADDLLVTGVVVRVDHPSESLAIVSRAGKPDKAFFVGQNLTDSITLEKVLFSHIVVSSNGRRSNVPLKGKKIEVAYVPPVEPQNMADISISTETLNNKVGKGSKPVPPVAIPPISVAAQHADAAELHSLIAKGADINVVDTVGATPIMYSAFRGDGPSMQVLLDNGANVNVENFGWTPLMIATVNQDKKMVAMLKRAGATR